jgi:Ca2+-binding RTX toxin-like protein
MTSIIQQLRDAQAAGDAVTYYTILEQNGDRYGKLAKSVVMSDAMGGTIARAYAVSVASSAGITLDGEAWAEISLGLIEMDLAARETKLIDTGNPLNLSYDAIQTYHNLVFDDKGLPADAWTANIPLNYANDPEAAWQGMLQFPDDWFWGSISGIGSLLNEMDATGMYAMLSLRAVFGGLPFQGEVSDEMFWARHTVGAFLGHTVRGSGNVTAFSIDLPSGGKFIGGADNVADVLAGTAGDDVIIGYSGNDILGGTYGSDRIYGGVGDDYVHAGPDGGDFLYGGIHDVEGDTVHFNEDWQSYTITEIDGGFSILLKNSTQLETLVFEFESFDFANATLSLEMMVAAAQAINGTGGVDVLHGTSSEDIMYGLGGGDTMFGHQSNDLIFGGAGNDIVHGGTGSDAMFGEGDNDTFHLGEALVGDVDYVNGGAGTDTVQMSVGAKFRLDLAGAAAVRNLIVADGFTAPTGHGVSIEMDVGKAFVQATETIKAANAANELHIGKAADIVASGAKSFDFTAGTNDKAYFDGSDAPVFYLTADAGRSKAGFSYASGVSALGIDEWNLGDLGSIVVVDKSHINAQTVTINANAGIDILDFQNWSTAIVYGLEPLIGGTNIIATGFERIYGGAGDDTFYGTDSDDVFLGFGGTNTFYGSLGADNMTSSSGNLIVDYSLSAAKVVFNWGNGTSAVASSSAPLNSMGRGDTLSATGWSEIKGSAHDDTLVAVGSYGTLRSNGGHDTLIGGAGNDTFYGADGYAEIIRPGDGNDAIHFGTGGGTLDFSTSTRAGVMNLAASTFIFGNQADTVTGEFTKLVGTQYGDTIDGTENADIIDGGAASGYDVIYGWGGDDTIDIRVGVVHGGDGKDTIKALSAIVFGEDGDDTIEIGAGSIAYGGIGNDTITASGGSTVHGDDGDDIITTISSNVGVTVHGGAGGDTITLASYYGYPRSTLSYEQSDAGVSLIQTGNTIVATGGHAEGDKIQGMFNLIGSSFADTFDLSMLYTGTIKAGGGDDVITMRQGSGTAYGDEGDDTFTLTTRDQAAYGGIGNDIFHGHGFMHGEDGDDEFFLGYGEYAPGAGSYVTVKVGGSVNGGSGTNTIHGGLGDDTVTMDLGSDTFIYKSNGGRDRLIGIGADDKVVLDGVAGMASLADVQANLVMDGSTAELRFDGNNQKIVFAGLSIGQVLALDWDFV